MTQTITLTHDQQKAEVALRIALDRYLTCLGWPERARDYAGAELAQTPAARSHLFGGQKAPDAEELAASVFATERGAEIKALVEEAQQDTPNAQLSKREAQLQELAKMSPAQRIHEARRLGLA